MYLESQDRAGAFLRRDDATDQFARRLLAEDRSGGEGEYCECGKWVVKKPCRECRKMNERYRISGTIGDDMAIREGKIKVADVFSVSGSMELLRRANCYDDLLAACQLAEDNIGDESVLSPIRAAIAKATGAGT